ncbi:Transport integral membrane protein OS=Streptomyces antimycoticus OX=68175 GN=SSPO_052090 PE=4 SV=1 [Streptomyces antimycoticus]
MAVLLAIAAISRRWTGHLTDATAEETEAEAESVRGRLRSAEAEAEAGTQAEAKAAVKPPRPVRTGAADAALDTPADAEETGPVTAPIPTPPTTIPNAPPSSPVSGPPRRPPRCGERDADLERSGLRRSVIAEPDRPPSCCWRWPPCCSGTQAGPRPSRQGSARHEARGQLNVDPVSVLVPL